MAKWILVFVYLNFFPPVQSLLLIFIRPPSDCFFPFQPTNPPYVKTNWQAGVWTMLWGPKQLPLRADVDCCHIRPRFPDIVWLCTVCVFHTRCHTPGWYSAGTCPQPGIWTLLLPLVWRNPDADKLWYEQKGNYWIAVQVMKHYRIDGLLQHSQRFILLITPWLHLFVIID